VEKGHVHVMHNASQLDIANAAVLAVNRRWRKQMRMWPGVHYSDLEGIDQRGQRQEPRHHGRRGATAQAQSRMERIVPHREVLRI
jgi:hypothetical protein